MRKLTLSRRQFGQGLGASLALAVQGRSCLAHAGPHEIEVRVAKFAFAPQALEVFAGDTVVWVNEDIAPHTATEVNGSWDTGRFKKGESARVTFDELGEFDYFCAFHPHMTGRIVVRQNPET